MNPLGYIALGVGLILVADILRNTRKRASDERRARLGSQIVLGHVLKAERGRDRMTALLADWTPAPRVMTDGEVRRINRKLRRQA